MDVCPNRANAAITMPDGSIQILHVDEMCNECGNCTAFCPYASEPCKDKLTLFRDQEAFADSRNCGFVFLPGDRVRVRLLDGVSVHDLAAPETLPAWVLTLIRTVRTDYPWLWESVPGKAPF